jgi:glycosyltransferase involved in cell wall biosynthesis
MCVYNGASNLAVTMNSILSQEGIELEFIVVNDGSTDRTEEILEDYARRDDRVRVIHQRNTGLTRALIRGCANATGKFIARQDAGDISLAGRLSFQFGVLRRNSNIVMTSCGTRFVGPGNEFLFETRQFGAELHCALQHVDIDLVYGPSCHTSVMFRRETYEKVGGYRVQFEVAQDLDLWMRLAEAGQCWATAEILCERHLSKNSISVTRNAEQIRVTRFLIKCAATRRLGQNDTELVAKFARQKRWRELSYWRPQKLQEARFYYFIGAVLRHQQPKRAKLYFWRAVMTWFPYPKAWYRIFMAFGQR